MKPNPVVWFEIYVQDMRRAKQFYESVFQCKLEKLEGTDMEMWNFPMEMNAAGCAGALIRMEGFAPGGNGVMVYFACDDCALEEGRVAAAGGSVEKKKISIGQYGHISLVNDTEGNMVGLHSMQ